MRIEVHAEGVGQAETQKRADAVRDFLVGKGVDAARLTPSAPAPGRRGSTSSSTRRPAEPAKPAAPAPPAPMEGRPPAPRRRHCRGAASRPRTARRRPKPQPRARPASRSAGSGRKIV